MQPREERSMCIRRASRGHLLRLLSWREVRGIVGFEMVIGAGCKGAVLSRDGGEAEEWPLV
jgi:hypothetical protein